MLNVTLIDINSYTSLVWSSLVGLVYFALLLNRRKGRFFLFCILLESESSFLFYLLLFLPFVYFVGRSCLFCRSLPSPHGSTHTREKTRTHALMSQHTHTKCRRGVHTPSFGAACGPPRSFFRPALFFSCASTHHPRVDVGFAKQKDIWGHEVGGWEESCL